MQKDISGNRKYIFFKDYKVLYFGRIDKLSLHSHITWSLCICMQGEFHLTSDFHTGVIKDFILIPPGVQHEIDADQAWIAFIFFEKYLLKHPLLNQTNEAELLNSIDLELWRSYLSNISELTYEKAHALLLGLVDRLSFSGSIKSQKDLDPRIQTIVHRMNHSTDEDWKLDQLAGFVNLSVSRFSHLFKSEVGVPVATYRVWLKLKKLSESLKKGKNLTFAAQESGFFDSSHFNRVFKSYFGVSPNRIFNGQEIVWFSE